MGWVWHQCWRVKKTNPIKINSYRPILLRLISADAVLCCKQYGRTIFPYHIGNKQKTKYRPISRSTRQIFKIVGINVQSYSNTMDYSSLQTPYFLLKTFHSTWHQLGLIRAPKCKSIKHITKLTIYRCVNITCYY